MQAYESMGELEKQADQIVPLQSRLELASNERDAAVATAEGLTPRPGVRAFEGLSPEGCKQLGAALDAHRFYTLFCHGDVCCLFLLSQKTKAKQHHGTFQEIAASLSAFAVLPSSLSTRCVVTVMGTWWLLSMLSSLSR